MATDINYTFSYADKYPRVHMSTVVDGQEVNNVIIDIAAQYNEIPTEVLNNFSLFLLEQFNILISSVVENNLNSVRYNEVIEPIRVICTMKTGCDEIIYLRENPKENINPFPPSEEI
jgi:hypothetical protein